MADSGWIGVHVPVGRADRQATVFAVGDYALVTTQERAFVFTPTSVFAAAVQPGDMTLRGNDVEVEATFAAPLLIEVSNACRLTDNRLVNRSVRSRPSRLRCVRGVIASNDIRGEGDQPVLEIEAVNERLLAIVGNVSSGHILLNGSDLISLWKDLNPVGV